ncbi:MAG: serine protease, partial [Actinobacteria bacterium]|nr:serine protease [Actinomycetota bacterium]
MMWELLHDLHRARGTGVRVAIVDSGVEASHPWVGGQLRRSYRVVNDPAHGWGVVATPPHDVFGHGTAVAGQIRRFAPEAELISVQVLGQDLKANSQALLTALRWLVAQDAHIINLSLSTMREQLALLIGLAVDGLYARRIACVCARGYHRTGKAYPTNFAGTLGVTYTQLPLAKLEFRPLDNVAFGASGIGVKVAWKDGGTRETEGSSFACPLVTGLGARLLSLRPDLTPYELKSLIKAYADCQ